MKTNVTWTICCGLVILIGILTLTPIVIPHGIHQPEFMGMPYTLWTGISVSLLLWIITYIGVLHHPGNNN